MASNASSNTPTPAEAAPAATPDPVVAEKPVVLTHVATKTDHTFDTAAGFYSAFYAGGYQLKDPKDFDAAVERLTNGKGK